MKRHFSILFGLYVFVSICMLNTSVCAETVDTEVDTLLENNVQEVDIFSKAKDVTSSVQSYSLSINMNIDAATYTNDETNPDMHMAVNLHNVNYECVLDKSLTSIDSGHINGNISIMSDDLEAECLADVYLKTEKGQMYNYSSIDESVWEKTVRDVESSFFKPVGFQQILSESTYTTSGDKWKYEEDVEFGGVPVAIYSLNAEGSSVLPTISYLTGGLCSDVLDLLSTEIKGLHFPDCIVYLYLDKTTGYPVKVLILCNQYNNLEYESNGVLYAYSDFMLDVMFDKYNMVQESTVNVPVVITDLAIDDGKALYGFMVNTGLQAGMTLVDDNLLLLNDKSNVRLDEGWFIESFDKNYRLSFSPYGRLTELGVNKEKYRLEVSSSDFSSDLYSFAYLQTGLNAKDSAMADQSLTNDFYTAAQDEDRVANIEVRGIESKTWNGHIVYYYYYEYTKHDNGFVQQVYTYYVELDKDNYAKIEVQSQTNLGESVALTDSLAMEVLEHYLIVGT